MTTHTKLTPQQTIDQIKASWLHPVIPRHKAPEATGYLVSSKTLANKDSLGTGPEGAFLVNGRIVYPTQNLLDWLKKRIEKKQGRCHE